MDTSLMTVLASIGTAYFTAGGKEGPFKTLNNLWYLTMHKFDNYVDKKRMTDFQRIEQEKEEIFAKEITEEIQNIPDENIHDPKRMIAMSGLENSKFVFDEPELRKMFAKLIAKSMDSRFDTIMHPSFSDIIQQLSPLDAELLLEFKTTLMHPVCQFIIHQKDGNYVTPNGLVMIFKKYPLELITSSLKNLQRLGLVDITFSERLINDDLYTDFYSHPNFLDYKAHIQLKLPGFENYENVDIKKGFTRITTFGNDLISICLD